MNIFWGAILTTFSLIGWLGQTITVLFPALAEKPKTLSVVYVFLILSGIVAVNTIFMAAAALPWK